VASGEREDEASPCSRLLDSVLMTLFRFISGRTRERDHQARRSTGRGHHRSRQPPPALTVSSLRLRNRTSGSNEVVHGIPFVPYVNEFAMYRWTGTEDPRCGRSSLRGDGTDVIQDA
jgi:hypothetical protein